jgi:Carbon storage regulator (could also regulate swarming and quorum sensing)
MLITKLKYGQPIRIGDDVIVTVLKPKRDWGKVVRVIVDAPHRIPVLRPDWKPKQKATDGDEENPVKTP